MRQHGSLLPPVGEVFMRIDTQFNPVFHCEDLRTDGPARAERKAFVFDGWSYQPIAAARETEAAVPAEPAH